ncbi:MAG: hypothetical protein IJY39_13525 [Clostridia bacterium]|nr:hypothetical protein [Clostridia bacterium]
MNKKKIMITALLLTTCAAATLTSCGGNMSNNGNNDANGERVTTDTNDRETKETNKGIIDSVEDGVENIGSDIADMVGDPENATHGTEDNDGNVENNDAMGDNGTSNAPKDGARHRRAVPYGK